MLKEISLEQIRSMFCGKEVTITTTSLERWINPPYITKVDGVVTSIDQTSRGFSIEITSSDRCYDFVPKVVRADYAEGNVNQHLELKRRVIILEK